MNILRVILATLVIFGTGAVSGFFVAKRQMGGNSPEQPRERITKSPDGSHPMDRGRRSMMDRMQRDFDLTDEQREIITKIFAKSRERSRELWQQMKEPMQAEVQRVHEEVKAVLSPDQAVKFEENYQRRREQYKNKNRESRPEGSSSAGPTCFIPDFQSRQCAL